MTASWHRPTKVWDIYQWLADHPGLARLQEDRCLTVAPSPRSPDWIESRLDGNQNGGPVQTSRVNPEAVHPPVGTYSHAVLVETADGTWIYVSGQVALDPEGRLVGPGDMKAQTRQVFENLRQILEANGATFADVVKIGTYLTTLDDVAGMREIRSEYLGTEPPASTAVQVAALVVPDALIEIDLVAVVPT